MAAEETKGVRKFFQNDIEYDVAPRALSPQCSIQPTRSNVATVDFFDFYKKAIKTRVLKKLEEEEEEKKVVKKDPMVPEVTINLDDDISHPPELTRSPPQNPQSAEDEVPQKKMPRRRGQASNLSWV